MLNVNLKMVFLSFGLIVSLIIACEDETEVSAPFESEDEMLESLQHYISTHPPEDEPLVESEYVGSSVDGVSTKTGNPDAHPTNGYQVAIKTGNSKNSGTDAYVYITLYAYVNNKWVGKTANLNNPGDDFERYQTDYFNIYADLGAYVRAIYIRHDNSGSRPGWYLDWVATRYFKWDQQIARSQCGVYEWLSVGNGPDYDTSEFVNCTLQ